MTQAPVSQQDFDAFLDGKAKGSAPSITPDEFAAFAAERIGEPGWGEAAARGAGAFGLEAGRGLVGTAGLAGQGPQALFESMDQIRGDVLDWFGVSKEAKDRLGAMAQAGTFVARKLSDAAAWAGEKVQGASEAIPRDERYSDRLIGQVGSGVGQSIGFIGAGALTGGAGTAGLAISSSVESMQQRAEQLGASDTAKAWMSLGGVPIGLVEMAGLERVAPAFGKIMKAKFGQKAVDDIAEHMTEHWIRKTAMQGTVEAGEEVVQNGIQWGLEKYTGANPEAALEVFESLKEEGVPAFLAATLLGGPMNKIMADARGRVPTEAGMVEAKKQAEAADAEIQKLVAEPVNVEAAQKRTERIAASVLARTNTPVRIVDRHDAASAGWTMLGRRLGVDVVVGEWDDTTVPAAHLDGVVLVNRKAGDDRVVRSLVFHEGAHAMLRAMGPQGEAKGKEMLAAFEALMPGFLKQSETIYREMDEADPNATATIEGTPYEEEGFAHSIERMAALVDVAMSNPQGQRALTEMLRKDRTVGEWMLDGLKSLVNQIPGLQLEKSVQARLRRADELMQRSVAGDTKGMKGTDAIQLALLLAETFDQLGPQVQATMAARKTAEAGAATEAAKPGEPGQPAAATESAASAPAGEQGGLFDAPTTPSEAPQMGADAAAAPSDAARMPEEAATPATKAASEAAKPASSAANASKAPATIEQMAEWAYNERKAGKTVGSGLMQRTFGRGYADVSAAMDLVKKREASAKTGRAAGRAATLELPDGTSKSITYEIVELDQIRASHDPQQGFKSRPGGDKNERPYHDPVEGKDLRERVLRYAEDPKPGFLVTDTPAATDGPPIVNEKGQVLGGNARAMTMELVYARGGEQATRIREAFQESAADFGIDPAAVAGMKAPVLVRRMSEAEAGAEGELSRILNDPFTAPRTLSADAVSRGSKIDEQAARTIAEAIGDGTLAEALGNASSRTAIVQALVEVEAMSDADAARMFRGQDKTLTEAAKETISTTLLGAVISDVRVLSSMLPSVRTAIMKALPSLVRAQAIWPPFGGIIEHAVEALTEARAAGLSASEIAKQQTIEDAAWRHDARAIALASRLESDKPKDFANRMSALAEALYEAAQGQGNLFGGGRAVRGTAEEFDAQVGADGGSVRPGDGDAAQGAPQAQFALAEKNKLGLYSKLERVLRDEIKQERFTGEQLLAMLRTKGVSKDELEWYRLAEYVEATKRPTYTKAEIADWIERVRPQITETVLAKDDNSRADSARRAAQAAYRDTVEPVELDVGDVTFEPTGEPTVDFAGDESTWSNETTGRWYQLRGGVLSWMSEWITQSLGVEADTYEQLDAVLKTVTLEPVRPVLNAEKLAFLQRQGNAFDASGVKVWRVRVPGRSDLFMVNGSRSNYATVQRTLREAEIEIARRTSLETTFEHAELKRRLAFIDEYVDSHAIVEETGLLRDGEQPADAIEYGAYTSNPDSGGTENYIEVLVSVAAAPGIEAPDATGGALQPTQARRFRVLDHFAGTAPNNRLMHYRADVTMATWDGKRHKIAVNEETQSDAHQKAREERTRIVKALMERDDLTEEEASKLVPEDAAYRDPENAAEIRAALDAGREARRLGDIGRVRQTLLAESIVAAKKALSSEGIVEDGTFGKHYRKSEVALTIARGIDVLFDHSRTDGLTTPEFAGELMAGREVEYLPGKKSSDLREIAAAVIEAADARIEELARQREQHIETLRTSQATLAKLDPANLGTEALIVDQPWRKSQQYSALSLKLLLTRVAKDPTITHLAWPAGVEHVKRYSDALRQITKRLEWESAWLNPNSGKHGPEPTWALPLKIVQSDEGVGWDLVDADSEIIAQDESRVKLRELMARASTPQVRLSTVEKGEVGWFQLEGKPSPDDKTLEALVGTAIAKDIRDAVSSGLTDGAFEGDQIRIGTKGMEGAYDKIMPSAAKDVGKRYGAVPEFKVVTVNGVAMDFWVMPITPELRAAALGDGLPQFALQPDDLERMGRAARKAEKEGERTSVGSSPNPIANDTNVPEQRAFQRGVRDVWSEGFGPVTRAEQQRKAEARLAADFAGERKRLMAKVESGELPTADEQIELKLLATRLVTDFLSGNSNDPKDFQEAAEANEAAELLYTYFEARAGAGRALGVIRDAFRANRTGKQHLADLVLTLSPDIRRRIDGERRKIRNIASTPVVREQARAEIKRLYGLEAERVRKAQDALREAGFDPKWIASSYFNDPATFGRIARIVASAKQGQWDWLIELRLANMLSAPITHARNVSGNAINSLVNQHLQRNAAALMNLAAQSPDAPTFGEQTAFYGSWLGAAMQAGRNFATSWKTELPIFEFEMQRNGYVIPGGWGSKVDSMGDSVLPGEFGRILRAPSLRLLTAADEFFKTLAAITEGHALAWRQATAEGLTGQARDARISDLMHGPTNAIHERSLVAAKRLTFQGERGPLARSVMAARSAVNSAMPGEFPLGSILLPFVGTPTAIFEEAISLPFHPVKTTYKAIAAALGKPYEGGKGQAVEDAARSAIAIAFVLAALAMAYDDDEETGLPRITGASPSDAGDRELANRTAPPMSVRIGGTYYGYGQLEPVATMLGALVDAGRTFRKEGTGAAFAAFVRSIPPIAADKTYLETVGEIYKIAQAQGDVGDKLARMSLYTFVTPMIPNIIRSTARSTDDLNRTNPVRKYDDAGLWESAARSLPYQALPVESIAPPPKYDLWGRPMEKQAGWFSRLINPAAATQDVDNVLAVDLLLRNYQARFERGEIKDNGAREITPTSPDYSFTYKGERHFMTDAEYERLQRDAGQLALRSLKGEFSPLQVQNPEWEDVRAIADEIRSARETVRNRIINDRRRKGDL